MQTSITERTLACLEAIDTLNPTLKAMITVNPAAMDEAQTVERRMAAGGLPAAAGLIVSYKDNIDTANLRTTMGSSFFAEYVPDSDAVVVERLRRAGCVNIGKANLHEFAFGGTTQNPHHGAGRNPWNTSAIPGGSSGGSGSSVAAGMCDVSLGTDTGGSIRIPAALNGVAGLRPTHGSVPNTGCFPVSAAYDTIGPLARTVSQVADVFEAMAGVDAGDHCMEDRPTQSWANLFARGIRGMRVGVPEAWCFDDIDPEVEARVREAIAVLGGLGAEIVRIELPEAPDAQQYLMPMVHADAAAVHAERLSSASGDFGPDVLDRLMFGVRLTSQEYATSVRFRERWLKRVESTFQAVDVIAMPTCPLTAPLAADSARMLQTTRGLSRFTYAWSMAGTPALSVPCGFSEAGLPVGLQLIGPRWADARVLALGAHYQAVTTHHLQRPSLLATTTTVR